VTSGVTNLANTNLLLSTHNLYFLVREDDDIPQGAGLFLEFWEDYEFHFRELPRLK
jgi:hypothetical protein